MIIGFIGDIVGRPGRKIIKENLSKLRVEFNIDFIVANGENASHGFGLTTKNCDELLKSGIDIITGGNHSFDKRADMEALLKTDSVLRPDNYPLGVSGSGLAIKEVNGEKIAVLNLMGQYGMPIVENPFNWAKEKITYIQEQNVKNIIIDFHAEATSEKRVIMMMFKGIVSSIFGTHTHVGTDDLTICEGTSYVSDVGLTGCRDNVIGMDSTVPIKKATTGLGGHFDVPNNCKSILQLIVVYLNDGKAIDAFKIKVYDNGQRVITKAFIEK
ncbi:TIGR00282 family metallophosphoesterase [Arcobacter sp. FWKO B]|uniref:TIGR00282 family metallophosphoesterase n=1 Tax=Arcobacter sp. FWKO B TaxID=2593672 RepID=UPI0018A455D4|nr:TIGR00282 family metallophosphoesterase [Arcobacter sp. FWKO B]QOG12752.1 YmdB family metallophosphoesterase [Arcobacter sp. FWKO B]